MAGYSGTPLPRKLGIKPDTQSLLIDAPDDFESQLGEIPTGAVVTRDPKSAKQFDVILLFTRDSKTLSKLFPTTARKLISNGGFWICWPKKASGVATDLTEDVIRKIGLNAGLVDNKVCAVDEVWSGLRFVIRLEDRK